tara:strand:+ start:343 stop:615 length:273 start_codon:yes stop_codon:yes gene_type:complete
MEDYDEEDYVSIGYGDYDEFIAIHSEQLDEIDYQGNQHLHSIVFCTDDKEFYKVGWIGFAVEGKVAEGNYMVRVEPVSRTTTVWEEKLKR